MPSLKLWASMVIDTFWYWHSHRVAIGTYDYVIHIFPPFPSMPMFTLCSQRYLYFCLLRWVIHSDHSLLLTFLEVNTRFMFALVFSLSTWLQLAPASLWPLGPYQTIQRDPCRKKDWENSRTQVFRDFISKIVLLLRKALSSFDKYDFFWLGWCFWSRLETKTTTGCHLCN